MLFPAGIGPEPNSTGSISNGLDAAWGLDSVLSTVLMGQQSRGEYSDTAKAGFVPCPPHPAASLAISHIPKQCWKLLRSQSRAVQ